MMYWQRAFEVATEVVQLLEPATVRAVVAGSVRREKPDCKDVEIVYEARMRPQQAMLFGGEQMVSEVPEQLTLLVEAGVLRWDAQVRRRGPKYQRLIHEVSGMVVELFRADVENWGVILALRTGPGDFNKMLVTKQWFDGCMPAGMAMREGYLWRMGERLSTPTEEAFFSELGVPMWEPRARNAARLAEYVRCEQLVAQDV